MSATTREIAYNAPAAPRTGTLDPARYQISATVGDYSAEPAVTGTGTRRTLDSFGAVGDGTTDDATAIANALTWLGTGGANSKGAGNVLVFTAGKTYRHSNRLVPTGDGWTIYGYNSTLLAVSDRGDGLCIQAANYTIIGLRHKCSTNANGRSGDNLNDSMWSTTRVGGDSGTGTIAGGRLFGCISENSPAAGLFYYHHTNFTRTDFTVINSQADGIHQTSEASYGIGNRDNVVSCGDDGIAGAVSYTSDAYASHHLEINRPHLGGNSHGRGISVVGGHDIAWNDPDIHSSSAAGTLIGDENDADHTYPAYNIVVSRATVTDCNTTRTPDQGSLILTASYPNATQVVGPVLIDRLNIVTSDTNTTGYHNGGYATAKNGGNTSSTRPMFVGCKVTNSVFTGGHNQAPSYFSDQGTDGSQGVDFTGLTIGGTVPADPLAVAPNTAGSDSYLSALFATTATAGQGRIGRAVLSTSQTAAPMGRIGRAVLTVVTANPRGRIGKVRLSVVPPSAPQGRIGHVRLSVTPAAATASPSLQGRQGGKWVGAMSYVRVAGVWRPAVKKVRKTGAWATVGIPVGGGSTAPTFTIGVDEPTAANTALVAKSAGLTQINGQYNVTDAMGDSVSGLRINGWVDLSARTRDFTFVNCDFPGLPSYDPKTLLNTDGSGKSWAVVQARHTGYSGKLNLDSCRIRPAQPDRYLSSLSGERLGKITRCDISLGSDLIDIWEGSKNVEVSGCFLHEYAFWSNDDKHSAAKGETEFPGWAHPDYVQITGGDGFLIKGNAMHGFASQQYGDWTLMRDGITTSAGTTADHGATFPYLNYGGAVTLTAGSLITNAEIAQNWFYGFRTHVINPRQPKGAETGNSMKVHGNRHDYGIHGYRAGSQYALQLIRWGCLVGPQPADVYDNVWMGTDKGVPAALAGKPLPAVTALGDPSVNTSQYFQVYYTATQPVPLTANMY